VKGFTLTRPVNLCFDMSIQFAPYTQARRCFALQVKCPLLQTNRNQTSSACVQSERYEFEENRANGIWDTGEEEHFPASKLLFKVKRSKTKLKPYLAHAWQDPCMIF